MTTYASIRKVVLLLLLAITSARAQETASSLAHRLENQMLAGAGVQMKFSLAGEGNVSITTDIRNKRVRMESGKLLIISNGSTIWNYDKNAKRVTIDNISATGSAFKDPVALFRFAEHYSASLGNHSGSSYTLTLTPDAQLQSLMKGAGNIQSLSLSIKSGKTLKIMKASVSGSRGESHTSAISIKSLKAIKSADFIFKTNGNMKIMDLRE